MDELDSPERVKFLTVIDKLREIGVGFDISLPQLVVVGDQSSGKSSLLEAITGLSFPVDSDICTRFATQIILRRSNVEDASARVTILPGSKTIGNSEATQHLESFNRVIPSQACEGTLVADVLGDASIHMGLPAPGTLNTNEPHVKRFSEDIVRIELCGPQQQHLSVVDVPGLFHNPTEFQTLGDKEIIHHLVKQYIQDKRTIILAVCNATNNLANQEVFQLAREADPKGQRTVGIVTKCDIVPRDEEETPMKIIRNEYEKLTHGWFAVKNRSTNDINEGVTIEMRHERELHFFNNTQPWSRLSRDRCGIGPLKTYLGKLLSEHVRGEFPSLVAEIQGQFDEAYCNLKQLGDPRQTSHQQRQFLTTVAAKYQRRVNDALVGNYRSLGDRISLKLRKHLKDLDDDFKEAIGNRGHKFAFFTAKDKIDEDFPLVEGESEFENIYEWIEFVYRDSRGIELPGFVSPQVLQTIFREQSVGWATIAYDYFESTVKAIEKFITQLLKVLVSEEGIRYNIQTRLAPAGKESFESARQRLAKLISDESQNVLKTTNSDFVSYYRQTRVERSTRLLKGVGVTFRQDNHDFFNNVSLDKVVSVINPETDDFIIEDIHDAVKAYYKVAIKRFTDNVVNSVVESDLLGEDSALKAFSPEFVGGLSDEELASIAAETSLTSATRAEYTAKSARLKQALDMARGLGV